MKKILILIALLLVFGTQVYAQRESTSIKGAGASFYVSMILDEQGFPVLSYWDVSNNSIRLMRCQDVSCVDTPLMVTIDKSKVSEVFSVLLDTDDHPYVLYSVRNEASGLFPLNLATCSNPDCDDFNVTTIATSDWRITGAAAFDSNGNLFVLYKDDKGDELYRLLICDGNDCENGTTYDLFETSTVMPTINLFLSEEGYPRFSSEGEIGLENYYDYCESPDCSEGTGWIIDNEGYGAVTSTELQITSAGNAVLSYYSQDDNGVVVTVCEDKSCSRITKQYIGESNLFGELSLILDQDDNPMVAHIESAPGKLYLVACSDPLCNETTREQISLWAQFVDMVMREDNTPIIAVGDKGLTIIDCKTRTCE